MIPPIEVIGEMVSEHPDDVFNDDVLAEEIDVLVEWFWSKREPREFFNDPVRHALADLITPETIKRLIRAHNYGYEQAVHKAMEDLVLELKSFAKHFPSVNDVTKVKGFIYYKHHGELPPAWQEKGEAAMDRYGHGREFRGGPSHKGEAQAAGRKLG
jgi:hypothetical protein